MTPVSYNGQTFNIPQTGDQNWSTTGTGVDAFLISVAQNSFQKTGGVFTLSADADFGAIAGLKSSYYKTRSANLASGGAFRLANTDTINFRNAANTADLPLAVNGSNQLTFNGSAFVTTTGTISASRAIVSDASGNLVSSTVTSTQIGYLGTAASNLHGDSDAATLTNKTMAAGSNTFTGFRHGTEVDQPSSGVHGVTGTLVGTSDAQTLTNKTFDTNSNTLKGSNGSNGQVLQVGAAGATAWVTPFLRNHLLNSNFDFWQRGTSLTVTSQANPATPVYKYGPDRWYVNNILGGGTVQGAITIAQVAGTSIGAKYGCSVKITTAPSGTNAQNGCELYQTLENQDSLQLYGQTASFTVQVKALGNVNQIGVQFFYKTTEAKVDTALGSEQLVTVNSSTFTACTINGQALGTAQTTSGVIGVRIRITGVSTGNAYDLNNGFVVEQAMLNLGTIAGSWRRAGTSVAEERALCQRYYCQSGDDAHPVPNGSGTGSAVSFSGNTYNSGNTISTPFFFPVEMRTAPTITTYDLAVSPAAGKVTWADGTGSQNNGVAATSPLAVTTRHWFFALGGIGSTGIGTGRVQYTADSEI